MTNKELKKKIEKVIVDNAGKDVLALCKEYALSVLPEEKKAKDVIQLTATDQGTKEGKLHYQREYGKREGFNQAITQAKINIMDNSDIHIGEKVEHLLGNHDVFTKELKK